MKTLRTELEEKLKNIDSEKIDKEKLTKSIKGKEFNKEVLK